MFLSRGGWIRYIEISDECIKTTTLFHTKQIIGLDKYELEPDYSVSLDNNQLLSYQFNVVDKETKTVKNMIFHMIPSYAFIEILEYYKMDTSMFDKRERKELPLTKQQRQDQYVKYTIVFVPLGLMLLGGITGFLEKGFNLLNLGFVVFSLGGIIYLIRSLIHVRQRVN